MLEPVVRGLPERDRRLLRMRFFDDLTQQEMADEIGVTQTQVSRLLSRILADADRRDAALDADRGDRVSRPFALRLVIADRDVHAAAIGTDVDAARAGADGNPARCLAGGQVDHRHIP